MAVLVPSSPEEFLRDPVGRSVKSRSVALWCTSPELYGVAMHGTLDRSDLDVLCVASQAEAALGPRFSTVADCRTFNGIQWHLFPSWLRDCLVYAGRRSTALARHVAIIDPASHGAVLARGFAAMVPHAWEQRFVGSTREALAAVEVEEGAATRLAAEIDGLLNDSGHAEQRLTRRERQVATLVADGLSDLNVARELGISESTVGAHVLSVFRKLGVHSRVELANRWRARQRSA